MPSAADSVAHSIRTPAAARSIASWPQRPAGPVTVTAPAIPDEPKIGTDRLATVGSQLPTDAR